MSVRTSEIVSLPRGFPSRYGAPVIGRVDVAIFRRTYFTACLACMYCHDACCDHGVDVDLWHVTKMLEHADGLEAFCGVPRDRWFTSAVEEDPAVPGGGSRRTRVRAGHCVFLNRAGRGCLIHRYCLERGLDYHDLKSMVDCLFPISFYEETLCPAEDVTDGSLVCLDTGPTLYRGLRNEVRYYFGNEFVERLDQIEAALAD